MSANVETMAYAGQLPWHGLGQEIPDNMTPEQIMAAAGCDWTVSKRQMFFSSAPKGGLDKSANRQPVREHFALVRDSDHSLLDVVGGRYQPTQNKDAFDFFDKFVKECRLKMHTAGSLCGGQYVWALAKTENTFKVSANDPLDSYILLLSPHKLGKSLVAKSTSVRVVCQNTLDLALKDGNAAFRMSHARKFDEHAKEEASQVLGLINDSFKLFGEQALVLAGAAASADDARQFFGAVFKMNDKLIDAEKQRKNSLMQRLLLAYEGEAPGALLSGTKGTYWGLVNAVTWTMDRAQDSSRDRHLKDSWMGWRGDIKRTALDLALKMAA